mmetsp:Transcript_25232/g.71157  ORF Transcript_25232/g.71157 Transcript_25232/m.71157 type:complete len:209 (+) Transcript_25232:1212-1838(+)
MRSGRGPHAGRAPRCGWWRSSRRRTPRTRSAYAEYPCCMGRACHRHQNSPQALLRQGAVHAHASEMPPRAASAPHRHAPGTRGDACASRGGSRRPPPARRSPSPRSTAGRPSAAPRRRTGPRGPGRTGPRAPRPRPRRRTRRPRRARGWATRRGARRGTPCRSSSGSRRRGRTRARRRRRGAGPGGAPPRRGRRARSRRAGCSSRGRS